MRKLMIVLLISVMLLSIPCATAANLGDLITSSPSPEVLEITDSADVPSVGIKIFVIDKNKNPFLSNLIRIILDIKKRKSTKHL